MVSHPALSVDQECTIAHAASIEAAVTAIMLADRLKQMLKSVGGRKGRCAFDTCSHQKILQRMLLEARQTLANCKIANTLPNTA